MGDVEECVSFGPSRQRFPSMLATEGYRFVGAPAGGRRPLSCLTTAAPPPPPWTVGRLRPLLRTPERRLSSLEARRGRRSPAPAAPKRRILCTVNLTRRAAGVGVEPRRSWFIVASTLFDDTAPPARLVPPGAPAAPTHPGAPPPPPGSSPWPPRLASGRPKVEDSPPPLPRRHAVALDLRLRPHLLRCGPHGRWKTPSALLDDRAPPASPDHPKARLAPTHPGAPPPQRGGLPWPQEPASACSQGEDVRTLPPAGLTGAAAFFDVMQGSPEPWP